MLFLLSSLPFSKLLLLQDILGSLPVYRSIISRVTRAEPFFSITSTHRHLPPPPPSSTPTPDLQGLGPLVLPQTQNLSIRIIHRSSGSLTLVCTLFSSLPSSSVTVPSLKQFLQDVTTSLGMLGRKTDICLCQLLN